MAHQLVTGWVDQAGGFLRTSNMVAAGGLPPALVAALEGMSNAQLFSALEGFLVPPGPVAGSGQYSLCSTTVVLNWLTAVGTGVQMTIPAPLVGIFGGDGVTVDPTSAPMVALIAAVVGYVTDGSGNVITSFNSGVKSSRKVEQVG